MVFSKNGGKRSKSLCQRHFHQYTKKEKNSGCNERTICLYFKSYSQCLSHRLGVGACPDVVTHCSEIPRCVSFSFSPCKGDQQLPVHRTHPLTTSLPTQPSLCSLSSLKPSRVVLVTPKWGTLVGKRGPSPRGICASLEVQAAPYAECPAPVTPVASFQGLTGYYRKPRNPKH